jgi:RNA polymerase sigma-70 factor (ECF subfamily)
VSVHSERARSGRTDWAAIVFFSEQLIRISPTLGTRTGYAAAIADANGPQAGLVILDAIEMDLATEYQPYWAVRAHLLQRLGRRPQAVHAYAQAIRLAKDSAVREFLLQKRV